MPQIQQKKHLLNILFFHMVFFTLTTYFTMNLLFRKEGCAPSRLTLVKVLRGVLPSTLVLIEQ